MIKESRMYSSGLITRGLIVKEPYISMILTGQKVWEMRSSATRLTGPIGLIRKGSGLVVGTVYLNGCSGPYSREQLLEHVDKHRISAGLINDPDYKWFYAWEMSGAQSLPDPVSYQHKNGAVIWVELDDNVVERISHNNHPPPNDVLSPQSRGGDKPPDYKDVELPSWVESSGPENEWLSVEMIQVRMPCARDGSVFSKKSCNSLGFYTVGEKGAERKFSNFYEALDYLRTMKTAKWRRPNSKGNWGIVSAVDWIEVES